MFSISFIRIIMFNDPKKLQITIDPEEKAKNKIVHTKLFFQGQDVDFFSFENFSSVYCVLLKEISSLVGVVSRLSMKY